MTTFRVALIAFVMFFVAGTQVTHDSDHTIAHWDVPTDVRGG